MTKRDEPPVKPSGLEPSSADLEGGLRFVHMTTMQQRHEQRALSVESSALVDLLISKGLISARELGERRVAAEKQEQLRDEKRVLPLLSPTPNKYEIATPPIPCEENLPVCRAACCYLSFYLSGQDLDEGVVKWDYFRPYRIRQRPDGGCVHLTGRGCCSVYEKRPATCRGYDCRADRRIWHDWDRRIPAEGVAALPPIARP